MNAQTLPRCKHSFNVEMVSDNNFSFFSQYTICKAADQSIISEYKNKVTMNAKNLSPGDDWVLNQNVSVLIPLVNRLSRVHGIVLSQYIISMKKKKVTGPGPGEGLCIPLDDILLFKFFIVFQRSKLNLFEYDPLLVRHTTFS